MAADTSALLTLARHSIKVGNLGTDVVQYSVQLLQMNNVALTSNSILKLSANKWPLFTVYSIVPIFFAKGTKRFAYTA